MGRGLDVFGAPLGGGLPRCSLDASGVVGYAAACGAAVYDDIALKDCDELSITTTVGAPPCEEEGATGGGVVPTYAPPDTSTLVPSGKATGSGGGECCCA